MSRRTLKRYPPFRGGTAPLFYGFLLRFSSGKEVSPVLVTISAAQLAQGVLQSDFPSPTPQNPALCINHVFYFWYSDALTCGALLTLESCPSEGKSTLKDSKQLAPKHPIRKPATPKPTPPTPPPRDSHILSHYLPVPIIPGPGTRQLRTPHAPESAKIILVCQL